MRWSAEHEAQHVFVTEGDKGVRYLLQSTVGIQSLLLTPRWLEDISPLLEARPDHDTIHVFLAEPNVLRELTGIRLHQCILACGAIPEPDPLERVLSRSRRPWLFAAAENLANAENLGALIRNAAAFDLTGVLVGQACGPPWLRRVVRTSMGSIFSIPVLARVVLPEVLPWLRTRGVQCVAAHPDPTSRPLADMDFSGDTCLVFGAEGHGLSQPVLEACEGRVAVPMKPGFDSLNVVSATGIVLHQAALRQGRMGDR